MTAAELGFTSLDIASGACRLRSDGLTPIKGRAS
jgi:hypothetical protein